jgi:transposase
MADLMEQHLAGILAHWKWGLTKAFMEGLNSVFSATKRKARGYPSTTYLITMLYFTACKLRFPPILVPSQTAGNPSFVMWRKEEVTLWLLNFGTF